MEALLGDKFNLYEQALSEKPKRAFHVNTSITDYSTLKDKFDFFGEKLNFTDNGYIYAGKEGIGFTAAHHSGLIYMQEPSAMLPVSSYGFSGDERVLDLCAAPGGKSSQIALKLTKGILFANETVPERASILARNIERMGYKNVVVTRNNSSDYADLLPEFFDVVLVDAPCSGEGMMRKEDEALKQWSPQLVGTCAERQINILDNAHKTLKSGGTLIYSTCTFSVEENERVVSYMVNKYGYAPIAVPPKIADITLHGVESECRGFDCEMIRRLYPFSGYGEGQTFAIMKKPTDDSDSFIKLSRMSKKRDKAAEEFIKKYTSLNFSDIYYDGKYFCLPAFGYDVGLNVIFDGIRLGQSDGKLFVPHHHFFSALGEKFYNRVELDEDSAKSYLHGNELNTDLSGWGAFTYLGAGLGGFKASDGKAKNHYPKGLRNLN